MPDLRSLTDEELLRYGLGFQPPPLGSAHLVWQVELRRRLSVLSRIADERGEALLKDRASPCQCGDDEACAFLRRAEAAERERDEAREESYNFRIALLAAERDLAEYRRVNESVRVCASHTAEIVDTDAGGCLVCDLAAAREVIRGALDDLEGRGSAYAIDRLRAASGGDQKGGEAS